MNSLATWFGWRNTTSLTDSQQQRCDSLDEPARLGDQLLSEQRFVVVDVETTGLNLNRDQVLSIGAVVIDKGGIPLGQQFQRTLMREYQTPGPSVLIHGIAPSEIAAGDDPVEVLLDFMDFVGDSPLLAFHARFDQQMLSRAMKESLGYKFRHPFLDLAEMAPMLCPQLGKTQTALDEWLELFGLQVQQRHNACADALVSAELALVLFNRAERQQLETVGRLAERMRSWQRRQNAHSF